MPRSPQHSRTQVQWPQQRAPGSGPCGRGHRCWEPQTTVWDLIFGSDVRGQEHLSSFTEREGVAWGVQRPGAQHQAQVQSQVSSRLGLQGLPGTLGQSSPGAANPSCPGSILR